jgi:hypothetical protein
MTSGLAPGSTTTLSGSPRTGREGASAMRWSTSRSDCPRRPRPRWRGERLARDDERRPDRLEARGRSRHEVERRMRELAELVGRECVDRGAQLDMRLAIGLQPEAGRAFSAVADPHRDGVASRR